MILNIWVKNMKKNTNKLEKIIIILIFTVILAIGGFSNVEKENKTVDTVNKTEKSYEISDIPEYNGEIYVEINNNIPKFTTEDMNIEEDYYSTLEDGKVRKSHDKN